MSEEENINQPTEDSQPSTEENKAVAETSSNNKKPSTNMEIHHHPDLHHKPKKWKEYFLEFLMIFLAVTLGFFAESIREHFSNKETEKQSIESLVKSLAIDTVQLEFTIKANIKMVSHLDSLVQLRNADLSIQENKRAFLRHAIVGFSEDWYFIKNDAAIQQLKSSGALRLIHNQNITDSIFKYETQNNFLTAQHEDCYWLFEDSYKDYKNAINIFFYRDTSVMKYSLGYGNSEIEFKNIDAVKIIPEKVNILFSDAATMAAADEAYTDLMQDQLANGKRLIAILKKEYDLKDE